MKRFNSETLDAIRQDADLFAAVSKAMGISPSSLPTNLNRNSSKLNEYSVVKLVAEFKGVEPDSLLEDVEDDVAEEQQS